MRGLSRQEAEEASQGPAAGDQSLNKAQATPPSSGGSGRVWPSARARHATRASCCLTNYQRPLTPEMVGGAGRHEGVGPRRGLTMVVVTHGWALPGSGGQVLFMEAAGCWWTRNPPTSSSIHLPRLRQFLSRLCQP